MTGLEPVTFRISEQDYLAFSMLVFRRSLWRCLMWLLPVIVILAVVFSQKESTVVGVLVPIVIGIVAGLAIIGLQWLMLPFRAAKIYRESAALQQPLMFSADDAVFVIEQEAGVWRSQWRDMAKWDENDRLFAIFINRIMANILPKDQVDAATIDYVRSQLVTSGLAQRGKLRK